MVSEEMKNEIPSEEASVEETTEQDTSEEISQDEIQEEQDPMILLAEENTKLKNECMRILAESDNYRKRLMQQQEEFKKTALKNMIEKLLPVVDNLERSIQAAETSDNISSVKEGVQMVLTQFETVLQDSGLEKVSISVGDEFDPQVAEALMMEERDDVEHSMTVVDVFETGRILNGQVIRTSKVKVAKKKS